MQYKSNFLRLFKFDDSLMKSHKDCLFIGIDEVGRGALAGPLITCAFMWKPIVIKKPKNYSGVLSTLNDSKKLTIKEREKLFEELSKLGLFSIGYASIVEIEKLNILNATFLGMKRAFENLLLLSESKKDPYVLIDGNKFNPYINCRQVSIIGGDAKSSLIASASVVAKVYRDMLMSRLAKNKNYKHFGWHKNVGYGTAFHCNAICKHGLTPLHRKLFVRKIEAKTKVVS